MVLNINKPIGWTSFDVVKKIRFITKEKKVGHGGTLDPFANGVLIVATGRDTKQLTEITGTDKSYIATIRLGEITNTLDTEGFVTEKKNIPSFNDDKGFEMKILGSTRSLTRSVFTQENKDRTHTADSIAFFMIDIFGFCKLNKKSETINNN